MPRLGELEQSVMQVLWRVPHSAQSVRDVFSALSQDRDLAYTTVLTVLDRLAKKKIVTRQLVGRSWHYLPVSTRAQMLVDDILDAVHSGSAQDRRELWEELLSRLDSDGPAPPCAALWTHTTESAVTPLGDRRET